MPELPDVETFRRYLDATALHRKIRDVRVRHTGVLTGISPRRLKQALVRTSFEATDRHGKYLFVKTGRSAWLVLHFGMTGFLEYGKDRQAGAHDRVIFDFENGFSLAYICTRLLGKVTLAKSPAQFARRVHLGPDALGIDPEGFRSRFLGSRASVKSCLMNQERIAGVGNIYSDEILFQSRLPPALKSNKLTARQIGQLYRKARHVLSMAADRKAEPAHMPASWLLPNRDEGAACPRCGRAIEKTKVAGRSAYWCPHCQKA